MLLSWGMKTIFKVRSDRKHQSSSRFHEFQICVRIPENSRWGFTKCAIIPQWGTRLSGGRVCFCQALLVCVLHGRCIICNRMIVHLLIFHIFMIDQSQLKRSRRPIAARSGKLHRVGDDLFFWGDLAYHYVLS